jgi:predicted DNA-binding transcriptional regulator AlpA
MTDTAPAPAMSAPAPAQAPAAVVPLLVDCGKAAKLVGVSRTTWWSLNRSGRCPLPVKLTGRPLWRRAELEAWTAAGCPPRAKWQAMRGARAR